MLKLCRQSVAIRPAYICYRNLGSKAKKAESDNEVFKLKRKVKKKDDPLKVPKEMSSYFSASERRFALDSFPVKLFQVSRKEPDGLYIASRESASLIADALKKNLKPNVTIIESNPGVGLLTKQLIDQTENDLLLFEPKENFRQELKRIISKHPERNITLRDVDINSTWRMAHIDKLDQGTRISEAFKGVLKSDFKDDVTARVVNMNGTLSFAKHLINSVIFQSSLMSNGRCELFMCLPPPLFIHLTCSGKAGYMLYRSTSVLFQLLFEYEFICKINRKDFLPWQKEKKRKPYMKMGLAQKIDPGSLYLMRAVPRSDLYRYCSPENLPALWFFIRQNLFSRKNRVIPTLERWIPNCGLRIILNAKPTEEPKLFDPKLDVKALPDFMEPCCKLSNENFVQNINIYTEFGDLHPTQVLTLFDQFINWPEFRECSFGALLEDVLIKLHTNPEESVDELTNEDESKAGNSENSEATKR